MFKLNLHEYFGFRMPEQRGLRWQWIKLSIVIFSAVIINAALLEGAVPLHCPDWLKIDIAEAKVIPQTIKEERRVFSVPTVDLLVPGNPIPAGTRLYREQFRVQSVDEDLVPSRSVRAADLPKLLGKFARIDLEPGALISFRDISGEGKVDPLDIPVGYRAVSIMADARSGVEGLARPGSLVDVLWVTTDPKDRVPKVTLVASRARVMSVAGSASAEARAPMQGTFTATLLAPDLQAKQIELASDTGSVSLSLIGDDEAAEDPAMSAFRVLSLREILTPKRQTLDYCITRDPVSGRNLKYVLTQKGWEKTDVHIEPTISKDIDAG